MIIIQSQEDGALKVGVDEGTAIVMMNGERVVVSRHEHLHIEPPVMRRRQLTRAGRVVAVLTALACIVFTLVWLIPTYWGWLDR